LKGHVCRGPPCVQSLVTTSAQWWNSPCPFQKLGISENVRRKSSGVGIGIGIGIMFNQCNLDGNKIQIHSFSKAWKSQPKDEIAQQQVKSEAMELWLHVALLSNFPSVPSDLHHFNSIVSPFSSLFAENETKGQIFCSTTFCRNRR
jgi:hypothetical protein